MESFLELILGGTELQLTGFIILCAVSFIGSVIAASLGLGGGLLVIAVMALYLSPAVLIPVHGVVQLGSNLGRTILMIRHVLTPILPAFVAGTVIGAAVGGQLFVSLPTSALQVVVALFVIYATWTPKFQARTPGKKAFFAVGVYGAFITMFVGATGPLVAPFAAAANKDRHGVVATHAMLMTVQHSLKVIAFGLLGFAFGPYIPLLIGLLACGFAGTWTGRRILNRLPEQAFRIGLKTILTLLALRLLYGALAAPTP